MGGDARPRLTQAAQAGTTGTAGEQGARGTVPRAPLTRHGRGRADRLWGMTDPRLLEILVCPQDKQPLEDHGDYLVNPRLSVAYPEIGRAHV